MIDLYDIEYANIIVKKKKIHTIVLVFCGLFAFLLVFLLTYFSYHTLIMILDILIMGSYFSYVFTYHKLIKKNLNTYYHFLAKIQQFDHEIVKGTITSIDEKLKTIDNIEAITICVDNKRTLFVETKKIDNILSTNKDFSFDVVDNFVVGYEVISND